MPASCKDLREDVIECVLKSDCVLRDGKTVKECLKTGQYDGTVPDQCLRYFRSFVDCKRAMWDMRKRFRARPMRERKFTEEEMNVVHDGELED
ncbi:mitochondrial inner membrane protein [Hyaloraphidium curvatum]|nr:mitochondrial inner membrane protein [Hyaloraphidium curvatum]